jgi:hypothetical protein
MSRESRSHLTHAFLILAGGFLFILATPVAAESPTTVDPSTQPHLKSWSNIIPNASRRFVVLADFNNEAVLDRETGLVWERSPAATVQTWAAARGICATKNVGNRKGWRLASFLELTSLIDPSVPSPGPALPPGHPFLNVQSAGYWSASSDAGDPTAAWGVLFDTGAVFTGAKSFASPVWCVRGWIQESVY